MSSTVEPKESPMVVEMLRLETEALCRQIRTITKRVLATEMKNMQEWLQTMQSMIDQTNEYLDEFPATEIENEPDF